jgi:hypothetical protein
MLIGLTVMVVNRHLSGIAGLGSWVVDHRRIFPDPNFFGRN